MLIKFDDERPIFVQIAQGIEDGIISGAFPEGDQVPSTTEISTTYKVNPATVLKGMNLLVDEEVLYKKRGIGMFVSENATNKLKEKRKNQFFESFITELVSEANKLKIDKKEIIHMIERGFDR